MAFAILCTADERKDMLHIFIINSFAGKGGFSEYIRTELEKKKNIEYLIFNSEYPGHEGALAAQLYELFENETIRFYACGGSGTFRNIMNLSLIHI